MKKILVLTLAAVISLSLVSCGEVPSVKFEDKLDDSGYKDIPAVTDRVTAKPSDTNTPAVPSVDDKRIYHDYLTTSGALTVLIEGDNFDRAHVDITSYLEDLNGDGIRELLLTVTDTQFAGVRGYAYGTYLYTIVNGKVKPLTTEYYSGGSMGGEDIVLVLDTETGKRHAAASYYFRDGYYFNESKLIPYSFDGAEVTPIVTLVSGRATTDSFGSDYANAIKSKTTQYESKDGELYYWQADDTYITKADYESRCARYQRYEYTEIKGTLADPLGILS